MRGYSLVAGLNASMQNLVVHVLAMRQLGRLNPRHLLAAGYGPRQTEWCPRTIHIRQLWGCSNFSALGGPRSALRGRDAVKTWSVHHIRFKSKKKGSNRATQEEDEEEEDEEDEDDEIDPEDSDYEDEDLNIPKGFKDMEIYIPSLRYDIVLKSGLNLTHNKVEDAFYNNNLRLNGQKIIKKSKKVSIGDILDLVIEWDKENVTFARVIFRKIVGKSEDKEQYKVSLRRWKKLQLSREEFMNSHVRQS